jgi:hypothetical protein
LTSFVVIGCEIGSTITSVRYLSKVVTAEKFAQASGTYWSAVLPRLDHFVRSSNLGPRRVFAPVEVSFPADRQALVSETAFMLWVNLGRRDLSADAQVRLAVSAARRRLREVESRTGFGGSLSEDEVVAVRTLAERLAEYTRAEGYQLRDLQVEPRLPGCGVVTSGVPDMLGRYADRPGNPTVLVEVKAVDRTFRSADFRQLVAYAVLRFAAEQELIEVLGLFNPLRGTSLEVGTEEFFEDVAGAPADEVVQRLMDDWSAAGVSQ